MKFTEKLGCTLFALASLVACSPPQSCAIVTGPKLRNIVHESSINSSATWILTGIEPEHLTFRYTRTGFDACYQVDTKEIDVSEHAKGTGVGSIMRRGDFVLIGEHERSSF